METKELSVDDFVDLVCQFRAGVLEWGSEREQVARRLGRWAKLVKKRCGATVASFSEATALIDPLDTVDDEGAATIIEFLAERRGRPVTASELRATDISAVGSSGASCALPVQVKNAVENLSDRRLEQPPFVDYRSMS